jgi:hypothetical protein
MNIKSTLLSVWITSLFLGMTMMLPAQNQNLYVLAPSGLNLRVSADPASKKIATLPYGAKVSLIAAPKANDLLIDNLPGGMAKVSADGQTGYIFDGYLCRWPAPKPQMEVEKYVEMARKEGLSVYFESHRYDYDGYYRQEDGVTLLKGTWREAFLIGKMLGEIPDKINFPAKSGKIKESVENPEKTEMAWSDQMEIDREGNGEIRKISYYYRGEGSGSFVNIYNHEDQEGLVIMVGGIAD